MTQPFEGYVKYNRIQTIASKDLLLFVPSLYDFVGVVLKFSRNINRRFAEMVGNGKKRNEKKKSGKYY